MRKKNTKRNMTSGLTFSMNGQRRDGKNEQLETRVEKMSNLKARKYQSLTKPSLNFCPSCDKQVIASAFGKLRINVHLYFQRFPNFVKTLKIRVKFILNFPIYFLICCCSFVTCYVIILCLLVFRINKALLLLSLLQRWPRNFCSTNHFASSVGNMF